MSTRSTVKIKLGPKAEEFLKEHVLQTSDKYAIQLIENPHFLDNGFIGWCDIKWYSHYSDVGAVLNALEELDKIVEEDPEKLKEYYYKMIQIEEDNSTYETTNDEDEEYTSDFYVICDFSL